MCSCHCLIPPPCYLIIGLFFPPVILTTLCVSVFACLLSLPVFAVLCSFVVFVTRVHRVEFYACPCPALPCPALPCLLCFGFSY